MPPVFDIAKFIAIFSCLIPVFIGLRKRELLWWLTLASFIADIGILILKNYAIFEPTHLISTLYMYVDIVLVTTYFYKNGVLGPKRNYVVLLAAMVLTTIVINVLTVNFSRFDTKGLSVVLLIYLIFSLIGYSEMLRHKTSIPLGRQPFFWGNTAIFIFAANTFFIFLMHDNAIGNNKISLKVIWMIGILLSNTIKNILIAISLSKSNHE